MATAVLLSLLAFSHRSADRRSPWMQVLAVLAVVAALAAKETAAVTPLAMALLLPLDQRRNIGAAMLAILPALLMVVLLLALGLMLLPYAGLLTTSLATRGPLDNLLAQTQGIGWLLGQLLGLEPLNADPALQPLTVWTSQAALTALGLVLLLLLAVWNLRARPGVAFGVLWFFLWLAPTNSLLARLDLANDRQLYLAIIGPGWLLGLALCRLEAWLRESLPAAALVLLAALAMTLSTATLLRNRVYDTEVDFWQDVALQSPHNARAANNLGMAHALACQPLAARAAFERATALAPQDPRAAVNLALLAQGELPGQPTEPACRFSPLP
jgi:multisubunit Na+/H+ antiporter MnhB subunit